MCVECIRSSALRCIPSLQAALSQSSEQSLSEALTAVLDAFRGASGAVLLQRRGIMILERLCMDLGAVPMLRTIAGALVAEEDAEFSRMMAQALNLLLLTSPELHEARTLIASALTNSDGAAFLTALYPCFCASSSAALALALLAQVYLLACDMVAALAQRSLALAMGATVVELAQLVSLLEAPAFAPLRLQLLDSSEHPMLLRCLYSVLMLLPQGDAFKLLQQRLSCIPGTLAGADISRRASNGAVNEEAVNVPKLLQKFMEVQSKRISKEGRERA